MTQITVILDNGADATFLQRMIENMKGVLSAKLTKAHTEKDAEEADVWFDRLEALRKNIDTSYIDMNDERTRYILSK